MGGLVVGEDLATAWCGVCNAGYFAAYAWRVGSSRARRIAAGTLALLSAVAVVEAAASQALFWHGQALLSLGREWPALWALARLPVLAGMVLLSAIVVRRMRP